MSPAAKCAQLLGKGSLACISLQVLAENWGITIIQQVLRIMCATVRPLCPVSTASVRVSVCRQGCHMTNECAHL